MEVFIGLSGEGLLAGSTDGETEEAASAAFQEEGAGQAEDNEAGIVQHSSSQEGCRPPSP